MARRRGKVIRRLVLFTVTVLLVAAVAAWVGVRYMAQPYKGYTGNEAFVEVPNGMGVNAIGARLVAAGVIRDRYAFQLAMRVRGEGLTLKAGEYRFNRAMTPGEVIDKIERGDVFLRPITFPEGLTIAEMARIYEASGFGKADAFVRAARDTSAVNVLDPQADDLEGYLFPETYSLSRNTTAADLIKQMTARFTEVYTPELRQAAAARGLSTRQVMTLASLVEKETGRDEERVLVSAVYHNRLKIGMGLQCDPTVIYALQRLGRYDGNLRRADLQVDSPYNTYRYAGLPPGPIASPGRQAIEAAIKPADVTYLYFVSRNDGTSVYASTLEEHNRNVHLYQVKYFRDLRTARKKGG